MTTPPFTLSVMTDLRPGVVDPDWQRHYEQFLDEARLIDELGFRTIRVPETHGHDDGMMPAPLTVLAAAAAVTDAVKLMTYIIPLILHRPREIVEQAAIVDLISGGRLELGVGAGGASDQFEAYGVTTSNRGAAAEAAISLIRAGLDTGLIADGADGRGLPVSPPPAQSRVPIYYGGLTDAAVDRAVRLADGCLPYDYIDPEANVSAFYHDRLMPALARHGRSRTDFFCGVGVALWVADDPERDWATVIEPAMAYRQRKYLEWAAGEEAKLEGMTSQAERNGVIIGTPEDVARRVLDFHGRVPFDDLAFWYRLPGVGHEQAVAHLERVTRVLVPLLSA